MEKVYQGTTAELAGNDALMAALMERERACTFLDGMSREELLTRAGQAEATIREASNVLAGCLERLRAG